jgi:hypothetical protein
MMPHTIEISPNSWLLIKLQSNNKFLYKSILFISFLSPKITDFWYNSTYQQQRIHKQTIDSLGKGLTMINGNNILVCL